MYEKINKEENIIAKNTALLYSRLILSIVISLYTSRVTLEILGIDDFGVYQTVGGVVGIMGFLSGALSTSSSRFITYALGAKDRQSLRLTFSTMFWIHCMLAVIIIIIAETAGSWFLYNKVNIPTLYIEQTVVVYQLSIISCAISITQIPYTAVIIAHEKMSIYAYLSILEAIFKLISIWLLICIDKNRLIYYALFMLAIQCALNIIYIFYCRRYYCETRICFRFDKKLFNQIIKFSGWSLLGNFSLALNSQGMTLITNMFFGPAIVTSRVIATQVSMTLYSFINNFRTAINPRIIKLYAAHEYTLSEKLLIKSAKMSFYLMSILGIPVLILARPIIIFWLGQEPHYIVIFLQLAIIQCMFSVFDVSFHTALLAKGQIKENTLITPMVWIIQFIIVYILFYMGYSPIILSYVGIISSIIIGLIIKPLLAHKIVNYKLNPMYKMIGKCIIIFLMAFSIPFFLSIFLLPQTFIQYFFTIVITITWSGLCIFLMGLDKNEKGYIRSLIFGGMSVIK